MPLRLTGILLLMCGAAMPCPATADLVINNLDEYSPPVGGFGISGYNYNFSTGQYETASYAGSFNVGAGSWEIDGITLRVQEWHPTPNDVNNPDTVVLRILNDDAGNPGSTVLGTLIPTSNIYLEDKYLFAPTGDIILSSGKYSLAAFPTATGSQTSSLYDWYSTGSGVDNGINGWSIDEDWRVSSNLGSTWSAYNEFDYVSMMYSIDAAAVTLAVPEPASLALMLTGTLIMLVRCRHRPD